MKNIKQKLFTIQQTVGAISKNAENPYISEQRKKGGNMRPFMYFDINQLLETLLPIFKEEGLLLSQPVGIHPQTGQYGVFTILTDTASGEDDDSTFIPIPAVLTDPQKIGACITYFRRYGLQTLLGLQAEDDDANSASPQPEVRASSTTQRASDKQKGFVKKLIKEVEVALVPQQQKDSILAELDTYSKDRCSKCIKWLQEKKEEGDRLNEQLDESAVENPKP